MIKAHPLIKGVLSSFESYAEKCEPSKKLRPKLRVSTKDLADAGFQGVMKTSKSETTEPSRIFHLELIVEKNKRQELLIRKSAKIHPSLGSFYEGDAEGERDVALFVEGMVGQVISELAVVGAITAINNIDFGDE